MTQCERLSNRMPDVALGRAAWAAEEQTHLDACDDCRAEWALVRGATRLGESLSARDPEALTAALLGKVARARGATRTRRRAWLAAGLAAAAVAIIAVRIPRTAPTPTGIAITSATVALPELDGLPDTELELILGSLDEPSGASPALEEPGLDDFDEHELDLVLEAWEG